MNRMRSARVFRKKNYNMDFEKNIQKDLTRYLRGLGRLDEMLPECPDLEQLWPSLAEAYLPDGVREFGGYPVGYASRGQRRYSSKKRCMASKGIISLRS